MSEKFQVMLKYADDFIMSKRQAKSKDELVWLFAKSPGKPEGMPGTVKAFQEHEYEVVEWDDSIEAYDGTIQFDLER